jgi:hypothetical protein
MPNLDRIALETLTRLTAERAELEARLRANLAATRAEVRTGSRAGVALAKLARAAGVSRVTAYRWLAD